MVPLIRKAANINLKCMSPSRVGSLQMTYQKYRVAFSMCKRSFVSEELLRLPKFDESCAAYATRYRDSADAVKLRVARALKHPMSGLSIQDAVAYIHLADEEDTCNFIQILTRCKEQIVQDEEYDLTNIHNKTTDLIAVQKCYRLNDVDASLNILQAKVQISDGFPLLSHILVMDLLIKNSRFQDCLDLAMTVLEEGAQIRSNDFYKMAILAAYKLNNKDGLVKANKIYDVKRLYQKDASDDVVRGNKSADSKLRRLISLYCIKQNRLNAGLEFSNAPEEENFVDLNLKVLAFLKAGNLDNAVRCAQKVTTKQNPDIDATIAEDSSHKHMIFRDVFFRLRDMIMEKGEYWHCSYLKIVSYNYDKYVSPRHIERMVLTGFRNTGLIKPKKISSETPDSESVIPESDGERTDNSSIPSLELSVGSSTLENENLQDDGDNERVDSSV